MDLPGPLEIQDRSVTADVRLFSQEEIVKGHWNTCIQDDVYLLQEYC